MMHKFSAVLIALAFSCVGALAYTAPNGVTQVTPSVIVASPDGTTTKDVNDTNPLSIKCVSGCSGGSSTAAQGAAAGVAAGWPTINGEPADATGTFTNGTQTGNVSTASVDGYGTALITINGTYSTASATFLASDDGGITYPYSIACSRTDGTKGSETGYTSLTNASVAWICPTQGFDSVKVLSSAVASGTLNVRISQTAAPTTAASLMGISGGGIASGSADSGNPLKTGGKYNSTPPVFTNGQRGDTQISPNGDTFVEEGGRTFCHISTATTTNCKSGAGFLHTLCINTVTASATITAYDNTAGSGTVMLVITNPVSLLGMGPICASYDLAFSTGLTLVTTGVQDITATYR